MLKQRALDLGQGCPSGGPQATWSLWGVKSQLLVLCCLSHCSSYCSLQALPLPASAPRPPPRDGLGSEVFRAQGACGAGIPASCSVEKWGTGGTFNTVQQGRTHCGGGLCHPACIGIGGIPLLVIQKLDSWLRRQANEYNMHVKGKEKVVQHVKSLTNVYKKKIRPLYFYFIKSY